MSAPRLAVADPIKKFKYVPILSAIERKAYAAAYKLLQLGGQETDLATPGGRRSATIDQIAQLLVREFSK